MGLYPRRYSDRSSSLTPKRPPHYSTASRGDDKLIHPQNTFLTYLFIYSAVVSLFVSKVWLFNVDNIYIKQSYRRNDRILPVKLHELKFLNNLVWEGGAIFHTGISLE
jgi:hypothetical protein